MDYKQYKLFKSQDNSCLEAIEIAGDYYPFVRSKLDEGYSQIVISSAIMLNILETVFIKKEAKIVNVDLIEEDEQYKQQMEYLIASANKDRAYLHELMKELSFLSENESVEIKNINIKYRREGKLIDIKLSVNGLIRASDNEMVGPEISFIEEIIMGDLSL